MTNRENGHCIPEQANNKETAAQVAELVQGFSTIDELIAWNQAVEAQTDQEIYLPGIGNQGILAFFNIAMQRDLIQISRTPGLPRAKADVFNDVVADVVAWSKAIDALGGEEVWIPGIDNGLFGRAVNALTKTGFMTLRKDIPETFVVDPERIWPSVVERCIQTNRIFVTESSSLGKCPMYAQELVRNITDADVIKALKTVDFMLARSNEITNSEVTGEYAYACVTIHTNEAEDVVVLANAYVRKIDQGEPDIQVDLYARKFDQNYPRWSFEEGGDDQCWNCNGWGCWDCNFSGGY